MQPITPIEILSCTKNYWPISITSVTFNIIESNIETYLNKFCKY